jgi:tRNA modification GTPase
LAVVRLSGPASGKILRGLTSADQALPQPRRPALRTLFDPASGGALDQALVTVFKRPESYTGEDAVEITCHGGVLGPDLIVQACVQLGARVAEPGEFTRRAYLNGRMDLLEAEGVADLVESRSVVRRQVAVSQMEGGLSARIAEARSAVIDLEAQLVHHLDFPMEDDAPVPMEAIAAAAEALADRLDGLAATAPGGLLLREGAMVVFAGRPNAGKSSLFNAILGESRAIVTSEPGTTRDAVEAGVSLDGFPFRLVDTAGLRDPTGEVERLGIEVARRYVEGADLVLYCLEADRAAGPEDMEFLQALPSVPRVVARTRSDEVSVTVESGLKEGDGATVEVSVSALSGVGLDRLKEVLKETAFAAVVAALQEEAPVITRERQVRKVRGAAKEIRDFAKALGGGVPGEVASAHLKSAETLLEEMLGLVGTEDVLDRVFLDFCVGK